MANNGGRTGRGGSKVVPTDRRKGIMMEPNGMSIENDIRAYLGFLSRVVTPATLRHSLGVMHVMRELSKVHALDPGRAMIAGLLHDVAKDLSPTRMLELAAEAGFEPAHSCERLPVYLHGPVGAYLSSSSLGVSDDRVLSSISAHTHVGKASGDGERLSWCLRCADILVPTRSWTGLKKLKAVVYGGKLKEGALLQTRWLIEHFGESGTPIHPNLAESHQGLLAELNVGDDFFERW